MTYMGPTGPIQPGTPQWHQADQANLARGQYVLNNSGHGAIAYSPSAGSSRTVWSHASRAAAEASVRDGMPADAGVYWGHHSYVALAQGSSGFGFGSASSAMTAMRNALQACGGTDARVTTLLSTDHGELDPQRAWAQGLRAAEMKRTLGAGLKLYVKICLIILFMIVVAAIGSHVPALAFLLIGLAIAYFIWRRRARSRA